MSEKQGPIQFMFGEEPRTYFSRLESASTSGKFQVMLQKYWLCAQLGLIRGRKGDVGKSSWVTDNFAPPLAEHQHSIRAFAFFTHCQELAVDTENEEEMITAMKNFFDQDRKHKLSGVGLRLVDDYAAGGFEILREEIPNPTDLSDFLLEYVDLLAHD
tara:strand:+ start:4919 stop:5392 length:474 start_codon:yes stop_codon:yes gene_type:complete